MTPLDIFRPTGQLWPRTGSTPHLSIRPKITLFLDPAGDRTNMELTCSTQTRMFCLAAGKLAWDRLHRARLHRTTPRNRAEQDHKSRKEAFKSIHGCSE